MKIYIPLDHTPGSYPWIIPLDHTPCKYVTNVTCLRIYVRNLHYLHCIYIVHLFCCLCILDVITSAQSIGIYIVTIYIEFKSIYLAEATMAVNKIASVKMMRRSKKTIFI